jgi:hypothetical protein
VRALFFTAFVLTALAPPSFNVAWRPRIFLAPIVTTSPIAASSFSAVWRIGTCACVVIGHAAMSNIAAARSDG